MKKLFAILTVTAFLTACNDTEPKPAEEGAATVEATADSISAANAMKDTTMAPMDTTMMAPKDTAK
ncbi:hypothetical protein BH11BAC3_BH11BAC3_20490 [soil metagenome]